MGLNHSLAVCCHCKLGALSPLYTYTEEVCAYDGSLQKSRTSPPVGVRKHSMSASWHSDKTGAGASSTSHTSSRTTRKWMVNRSKTNETGTKEESQELSAAPGSSQQSRKASTTEGS